MTTTISQKKIAIITGCSSGIGLYLALQLSECSDYIVIATMRTIESAPLKLRESSCILHQCDVTDDTSVQTLYDFVFKTYCRCDLLVNNAGYGISGSLEFISITAAQRVFEVNVWGVMRLCQSFLPLLRTSRNGGLIVTVSSTSGVIGQPFSDIYTASKQAIEGLLESFRFSVVKDNIKVLVVNPGPTVTDFSIRFQKETEHDTNDKIAIQWTKEIANRNLHGQSASDCAKCIVNIIEENVSKDISKGNVFVPFRNGTSDFSRGVLNAVLKHPDGCTGIYAERFEFAKQFEQEVQAKQQQ